MSAITFVQLLTAFLLLGISSPLVLALITAVIDALPVFGSGTVLLPWALWEFLSGDRGLGLGLAISYAAITVLRSCIQAKLLGDQLGLHPIITLAAMFIGLRLFGFLAMFGLPVAISFLWKQRQEKLAQQAPQ
jgi:predicted PurR-regulated permease PerM